MSGRGFASRLRTRLTALGERYFAPMHWREGLLALPALPLIFLGGVALGHPVGGAMAAGSAFSVGFGSAHDLFGRRWAAMLAALVGMMAASFAGTLLGGIAPVYVPLTALLAVIVAWLALRDTQQWWVALQVAIVFLIAGHFHGPLHNALFRTEMVLVGGGIQAAMVMALAWLFPRAAHAYAGGPGEHDADPRLIRAHMLRAALCVVASLLAGDALGLVNGYWAPMTALLVLKPRLHETRTRGLERLGGTFVGAGLASVLSIACRNDTWVLVTGMAIASWCAFSLQKAHYAGLSTAITASAVLLVSLGGLATPEINAVHRLIATMLGGGIALGVAALFPHSPLRPWRQADDTPMG
ncbi:FUSC family protein [Novosphingobium sp. 9]|uniref:FUSC family protein n=1 Tax=Novosphingobium sp. 9 TaxID=2025349 RepID=UPI0021B616AD|nr:FUSC family protein [Novosphingobium sp. 9]